MTAAVEFVYGFGAGFIVGGLVMLLVWGSAALGVWLGRRDER